MDETSHSDPEAYSEDPLDVYLRLLSTVPVLDRAEEARCVEHVRASDQLAEASRTRLVEANLHLVVSTAQSCQDDRHHILDLIEKGNAGLIAAANSLTEQRPDSFADYAKPFIERAVAEAVASDNLKD